MSPTLSSRKITRHAIVLGFLNSVGPFAIDMYLPAFPAIARDLRADPHAVQLSLMAFFVALGAGQLIAGPLSDMFGRLRPMFGGLLLFVAASIGCAFASTIETLIVFRFLQGLGACASMVMPRAILRDLYSGPNAARVMSIAMIVYSVSPILAPLAGSFVADGVGWRGIFAVLGGLALLGIALTVSFLPETRPPASRMKGSLKTAMSGYRVLLTDRRFLGIALIASLTLSGFFVYAANSSFVMSSHFGVSPRMYAVLFALNAISLITVSQFNGWLARRFGLERAVWMAIVGHVITMTSLLVLTLAGVDRLDVMVVLLFIGYGLNGVIVPSTFVLAMEGHAALAGTASALIGTLNFVGGAVAVALVAPFANSTPLPMLAGIAACSVIVFGLGLRWLRPRPSVALGAVP
jgi:DHA1 family bicyclomycin/chloramphenicol resistance-like MFS transporter